MGRPCRSVPVGRVVESRTRSAPWGQAGCERADGGPILGGDSRVAWVLVAGTRGADEGAGAGDAQRHGCCASVDAVYALISRHKTVPSQIAQRVISSGESADNAGLITGARALQADVEKTDNVGAENEMSALGSTCKSLGVGPANY